ncbi:AP-4-A phosphorylase [Pseudovibrio sp. W64]|uniref:HIT family protein n=1 Tax=Pseudovibrio sp. W64 TaxID=1735583 RepID=UPI0007AE94DF|nr:HIT family protein [Pseudovibrio sp. W64]KZK76289.1 AP-4-A phosphorylase [Pseudovibrio sp. W64]
MTCIFCAIAAGEAPAYILCRNHLVLAFLSLEGHPLIVPRCHLSGLNDLDDQTAAALFQMATRVSRALRTAKGCDGINLILSDGVAAGQDVFHAHLHVKPRWSGDEVILRWDTSTAPETRRSELAAALQTQLSAL